MKFCENCNNMMYIKVDDTDFKYYCKNCNFTINEDSHVSKCIMHTNLEENISNYKQFVTPYIKYDKTLPRVNNIICPNPSCSKEKDKDNMVVYIKYNNLKMLYLYYCCHCEHFWRSGEKKI